MDASQESHHKLNAAQARLDIHADQAKAERAPATQIPTENMGFA